jgi:hypothetical protein
MSAWHQIAYQMARNGYGWEDIQSKLDLGVRKDPRVWEILTKVHAQKAELRRNLPSLKKEKGIPLHG